MLAARTDTPLRGGCPQARPDFITEKDILELNHARIGK
jgi:hypothetical protein